MAMPKCAKAGLAVRQSAAMRTNLLNIRVLLEKSVINF
jgi:hypothetical protein